MPTIKPDKGYAQQSIKLKDYTGTSVPQDWLTQLGNLVNEESRAEFLANLQRHTGNNATYTLKPFVLARGLSTPIMIIFIDVLGGIIGYGLLGVFIGPIVLAIFYDLVNNWCEAREP